METPKWVAAATSSLPSPSKSPSTPRIGAVVRTRRYPSSVRNGMTEQREACARGARNTMSPAARVQNFLIMVAMSPGNRIQRAVEFHQSRMPDRPPLGRGWRAGRGQDDALVDGVEVRVAGIGRHERVRAAGEDAE